MKRIALLILLLLLLFCLTGCKNEEPNNSNSPEKASDSVSAIKETKLDLTLFKMVGNIVTFGSYEQDNNPDNGSEPIEWIVLDVQDGKALLLSRYILDQKPYNNKSAQQNSWKNSTLRKWLNNDFLNAAFNEAEKRAILTTSVDDGTGQDGASGKNTDDQVFLLSLNEAETYFSDDESRKCASTGFAIANNAYVSYEYQVDGRPAGWWWLRLPHTAYSYFDGYIGDDGLVVYNYVNYNAGVRPALWLNLESDIF